MARQVGGMSRCRDLGLQGDDRSHMCQALGLVPGSQDGAQEGQFSPSFHRKAEL